MRTSIDDRADGIFGHMTRHSDMMREALRLFGEHGLEELHVLTRAHTGFDNFLAMLHAPQDYRPTIQTTPRSRRALSVQHALERIRLADAYDVLATAIGDERRAYRQA